MSQNTPIGNLPVDQAIANIHEITHPRKESETIGVRSSLNRVLVADVTAQYNSPKFDNSAMDGYLFLTQDLKNGLRRFKVVGEVRPEYNETEGFESGLCKQIMTGAPVPTGDFSVVPIEMIREHESEVEVVEVPGRNPIRKKGEGFSKGNVVLQSGSLIRPYEVGLMIESGNRECRVLKKIRIAIQVTGSEIDESKNSNGPVLEGLTSQWPGVSAEQWPVLDDDPTAVADRMGELKENADVVLTTGGISMGKHDYILGAMQKLGAEVIVRKVQQKPGKPFTVTRLGDTLFFHLPGNPVSAVFTAEYYVRRAVYSMLNLKSSDRRIQTVVELRNPRPDKTLFVPGKSVMDEEGRIRVTGEAVMKSHLLQLYRENDLYIRLDPECHFSAGDFVNVMPFTTTRLPDQTDE